MVIEVGGTWTNTNYTTTIRNTEWRTTNIKNDIWPNIILQQRGWCDMTPVWTNPPIMPVCAKIKFLGGEVGGTWNNTPYTITSSAKFRITIPIWLRRGPIFFGMAHGWIIPNIIWNEITNIKPKINLLREKVGGTRTHTTLTITIINTKLRNTRNTKWIIITELLCRGGCYGKIQILEVGPWTRNPVLADISTFAVPLLTYILIETHVKGVPITSS